MYFVLLRMRTELQVPDPGDASRLTPPFCPFLLRPLVGKTAPESLRLELVPRATVLGRCIPRTCSIYCSKYALIAG